MAPEGNYQKRGGSLSFLIQERLLMFFYLLFLEMDFSFFFRKALDPNV
jgi:hypothetical protein